MQSAYELKQQEKANRAKLLMQAIRELDTLNNREYQELTGGKFVNGQLQGGEMVIRKGIPNWHERDTLEMMRLRHLYNNGMWRDEKDRHFAPDPSEAIALTHTLSSDNIRNLADFIEFRYGNPKLVEGLRAQAEHASLYGDVKTLYGKGISSSYDVVAENEQHREGFTYFYFEEIEGSVEVGASPPPGVKLPDEAEVVTTESSSR